MLETLPPLARFVFRGNPAALGVPATPLRATRQGERIALWQRPDEWLLLQPEAAPAPQVIAGALVDPAKLLADLGAWWATRGDVLAASGVGGKGGASAADAFSAYGAAVAHDPLSEQAACGWASTAPAGRASTGLKGSSTNSRTGLRNG